MKHVPYTRIIASALLILTVGSLLFTLFQNSTKYTSFDFWKRYPDLKSEYGSSQYVIKNPKGWIPDEPVNAFAGAAYVKEGVSPILIAADTPPFGRYIIGVSALLFNNENLFILVSGIGSLIIMYLLGKKMYKSTIIALLPVFLLSLEPIFQNQFKYVPLLDIMQLFFLLLAMCMFILGSIDKKNTSKQTLFFALASLFLGMFISTKFYATGLTIIAAWGAVLLWNKEYKKLVLLGVTLPISILFLLANYSQLLFHGYSLQKFLGVQKYIFVYHQSQLIHPFTIWPLILFNKWYVWWGNVPTLSDPQWRITWPILTLGMVAILGMYLLKKIPKNQYLEPLLFWSIIYILFFSFGEITARYLVILIPVLYLVFFYGVTIIWNKYSKKYAH